MEEGSLRCDANVSVRPAGDDGLRRQDRGQEPQLVPPRPARARVRDRAADRRCVATAARARAGDAAVGSGGRPDDRRCAQGRGATTTAISRSRICRRSTLDAAWIEQIRGDAARAARRRGAGASSPQYAPAGLRRRRPDAVDGARRLFRATAAGGGQRQGGEQLGDGRADAAR